MQLGPIRGAGSRSLWMPRFDSQCWGGTGAISGQGRGELREAGRRAPEHPLQLLPALSAGDLSVTQGAPLKDKGLHLCGRCIPPLSTVGQG